MPVISSSPVTQSSGSLMRFKFLSEILSDFICSGCGASGELADQWSSGTPIRHLDNQRRARYTEGGVSVNFNFKVKK